MKQFAPRLVLGVLLIAGGALLLAHNLELVNLNWQEGLLWPLLFGLAGMTFLAVFAADRDHWWGLIPGFVFLALATLTGLERLAPGLAGRWGGSIFLGGLSLGFWLVYLARREHWWAIIPGGVLLTLAAVAGMDQLASGPDSGALFFFGLAVTFGLVYLAPTPHGRMTWAIIPAAVCLILALAVFGAFTALLRFIWPIALIAAGLYFIWRSRRDPNLAK